jgi:ribonuclease P protein component
LAVGNAVRRNRAKRLLRAAMNQLLPLTVTGRGPEPVEGSDLLLIARSPLPATDVHQVREALSILLKRAGLLSQAYDV